MLSTLPVRPLVASAVIALTLVSPSPSRAQNIDTRGANDSELWGGFGIYGQTFTAPNGGYVLTDFSFWVGSIFAPFDYRALLYSFDGSGPTGAALFVSAVVTQATFSNPLTVAMSTFETGGIALSPGVVYMALLQRTTPGEIGLGFTQTIPPKTPGGTYAGGAFYAPTAYAADPTTLTYLTDVVDPGGDLQFTANFAPVSAVPEPATLTLVATGFVGFASWRRRQRARVTRASHSSSSW